MIIQFIYLTPTNQKTFNQNLFYIFFDLSFNLDCISFFIVCISCKILKLRYIGTAINPTTRIIASNSLFSATSSNSIIFAANKINNSNMMRLFIILIYPSSHKQKTPLIYKYNEDREIQMSSHLPLKFLSVAINDCYSICVRLSMIVIYITSVIFHASVLCYKIVL